MRFISRKYRKYKFWGSLVLLVVVFSLLVDKGNIPKMPSWRQVFNACKVSEFSGNVYDYDMSVHIMDVGKADSIFINCNGKNILIDAGDKDLSNKVTGYLLKNDVKKIDLVVVSHPHRDHIGQMSSVVNKFDIDRFMMPQMPDDITPTYKTYETLLKDLYNKNIKVEKPIPGDNFYIGDMKIDIFGPNNKYEDINNNSIVLKISYGNDSFLFVGDQEKTAELDLIKLGYNLKSTVLKVGHHGSATSTTQRFLSAVSPEIAVVSVGSDSNNLPKESVINRIKDNNIDLYRTDKDGIVVLSTNGNGVKVTTEKGGTSDVEETIDR